MWSGLAVAVALALSMQSATKVDTTRAAYLKCMRLFLHDSLKDKMTEAAFDEAAPTACAAEQTAFHDTLMAADRAMGLKPATAKSNADGDVADYIDSFREKFADFKKEGGMPERK